jgi:hypothetical protein
MSELSTNTVEQTPEQFTDNDVVTLITTVQQIMTALQTADIEGDRFAVTVGALYGLVMRK